MTGPAGTAGSGNGNRPPSPPTAAAGGPQPPPEDDLLAFWQRMARWSSAIAAAVVLALDFLKVVPLVASIGYVLAASAAVQLALIVLEAKSLANGLIWRNPVARRQAQSSMARRTCALVGVVVLMLVLGVSVVTLVVCLTIFMWLPQEWMRLKRELPGAPFLVTVDLEDLMRRSQPNGDLNGNGHRRRPVYDQERHDLTGLVRRRVWEMIRDANGAAAVAACLAGFSAFLCGAALAAGVSGGHLHLLPRVLRRSPNGGASAEGAQEPPSTVSRTPGDGGQKRHDGEAPTQGQSVPAAAECPALPAQPGVPSWARQAVETLYRGSQSLGPQASGCPATIHEKITPHGLFVWTLGEGADGRLQSVAAASQHLGDSIFISPAAEPVLELIETIGAVGGPQPFPRYSAGAGDYYIVNSERGSYLLMREEAGTSETAVPYVELAPSAATALIAADREMGVWLWPSISSTGLGRVVYSLRASADGAVRAKIVYDPVSGTAERKPYPVYERDQAQLSPAELQGFAPPAPGR